MKNLLKELYIPAAAVLIAIIVGSIIMLITGFNPITAYISLFIGAFGTINNIANTLAAAVPLILTGLGVAISFKAGLFNIGAEGQYWIGAIVGVWVGYSFTGLPWYIHIPFAVIAAMIAGGLWAGLIPGLAKAHTGANEVITTMMMSYIAIYFSHFLLEFGPMMEKGRTIPQSPRINESAVIPVLIKNTQLSYGIFIALAAAIFVYWLMFKTTWGFEMRAVGYNQRAARYAGMNVPLNMMLSLGLSGAFAGLAGAVQMLGVQHRLYNSFTSGYGYTAIVVSLLANNNPLGVIFSAILFAALGTGSQYMQLNAQVPGQMADVITGLIVFFVAAHRVAEVIKNKFAKNRKKEVQA
ncbi:inner-membrane translocator [Thermoanaerobacter mathranii subsp. mathranii str. A3]|uniref:Inner-membrane translocator n=1 Tax=Thermoanaerobacter mathranii subsp. mathranii (strain DSM 11426 / CCUG 53645 / CIP 108742 / A3) TaxID=583358 RepID=A0ABM5LNJ5_THEM3|nr:ABC transporter permease [Thermoanaerobacter mathranii]ADH60272.1 inner-membrane translocator [Thermoanaerobacter mathranii subsp. mathranii str. A3]